MGKEITATEIAERITEGMTFPRYKNGCPYYYRRSGNRYKVCSLSGCGRPAAWEAKTDALCEKHGDCLRDSNEEIQANINAYARMTGVER